MHSENLEAFISAMKNGEITSIDGVMSQQTVFLAHEYECVGIDMNRWWAMTPTYWTCPACQRNKSELVRMNRNGELMCHLVEHHDHMQDLLLKTFERKSSSLENVVATEDAQSFANRASSMVSAYENVIICVDCNNADAEAKKISEADSSFSFSAVEIGHFIVASANQSHKINASIARSLWVDAKKTFELRLRIIERIAEIAARDKHWFQPSNRDSNPEIIQNSARNIMRRHKVGLGALCGERESKPLSVMAWRTKSHEPCQKPNKGEIEHIAKVSYCKIWSRVPDNWVCPACNRSKVEIIRKNRRGEWTFPMGGKRLRSIGKKHNLEEFTLCGDCGDVAEKIGREAHGLSSVPSDNLGLTYFIELREIEEAILPRPHSRHNIKIDLVESIVRRIADRLKEA